MSIYIDSNQIERLVELSVKTERNIIDSYYNQQSIMNNRLSKISSLRSFMMSLKSSVSNFTFYSNYLISKKVSVSDENILTASSSQNTINSSINIEVLSIAENHKIASSSFLKDQQDIFQLTGSGRKTFNITINGVSNDVSIDIDLDESNTSILSKIAKALNSGDYGVVASIVSEENDKNTLIIESKNPGTSNTISIRDLEGNLIESCGIADFNGNILRTISYANDASIKVGDNFIITRGSNEIKDAIYGITLNIKKTGSVTISVSDDNQSIIDKINQFVNSFNKVVSEIGKLIYEEKSDKDISKGVFNSNTILNSIRNNLRKIILESNSDVSNDFNNLFKIGFKSVNSKDTSKENSFNIEFDSNKFLNLYNENKDQILKLLTGENSPFKKLETFLNQITTSNGTLDLIYNSTNERLRHINKNIASSQNRLNHKISYYRALYSTLSDRISAMKNQGNILNGFLINYFKNY